MADFIKREDVLAKIDDFVKLNAARGFPMGIFDIEMMRVNIAKMPAADVAPVVHGRWIEKRFDTISLYQCSNCKSKRGLYISFTGYKYCPDCGAKMDEEEKSNGRI